MNYTNEAWEEEQMSNLGCESVSDLIAEVKRLREAIEYAIVHAENHDVIRVLDEVMKND